MNRSELLSLLSMTFEGFNTSEIPGRVEFTRGKVRDIFDLGHKMMIVTTDRISAFDRVLTTIPCKGEILNRMAVYWFRKTEDIIRNHLAQVVGGRTVVVQKCRVLPVEVVVRGYLTGSAWRDYTAGKAVSGITLPGGMKMNQAFSRPLLTPSTKAERGTHDVPISGEELVSRGIIEKGLWKKIEEQALRLFQRGTELASSRGLILVDTKYEFGLLDGDLVLVDEIHTPDSSRFWFKDTYPKLFEAGEDQRKIDKEYLRQWLMEKGFMGDGIPPRIPDEVRIEVASRYIQAFELITGEKFTPFETNIEAEKERILSLLA
ncbi:MAG: phosphoribosylaminoimidazolesuccinocarboxamide synthase [Spirochaetota bacterium]